MTPTFEADGVQLFLGDAATVIPSLVETADLIATDPPYGVAYQSNRREATPQFDVIHGDRGEVDVPGILTAAMGKLRPNRHVYVFGPLSLIEGVEKLTAHVELVWDKENIGMGDLSLPWGPSHEALHFAVFVPSKANRARGDGRLSARLRHGSVLRALRPNSAGVRRHPNEKPVEIMRQIVEASSCLGDTVLDPFMGSGSTVVAALLSGRRAIGIEKDEKHFREAVARVERVLPALRELESA